MPRSVEDILAQAEELSKRFENYEPLDADELSTTAVLALRDAVTARSAVEEQLILAVKQARQESMSWKTIGNFIGTSGEAARQKYSPFVN